MLFTSTHPVLRRNAYTYVDRSLERFLNGARADANQPSTQYQQDDTAFHISLDVPGIAREQLAISIEGAVVRISNREGAARKYRMAYELPQEVDAALSEAKLENGVLSLKLTKKVPVSNAAEISVQ